MSDTKTTHGGNVNHIIREYFDSLQLELRMIDARRASTDTTLFGTSFQTPVMTAALSRIDLVAMAQGAAQAGAAAWMGIGDEDTLKAMIDTGAKVIKIVKPYEDEDLIYRKLEAAEQYGAIAVGMDIDFFFGGKNMKYNAKGNPVTPKTLDQMKGYVNATKLPFIMKGVLSEQDAKKALDAGAGGIVVSQHSVYVLDYTLPPARILPRIAKVVDKKIPIFIDGNITRGIDVFKCLALGADAVSVGAPLMAPLSSDGAEGMAKVIAELTEELAWTMEHTGAACLDQIDPSVVWLPEK